MKNDKENELNFEALVKEIKELKELGSVSFERKLISFTEEQWCEIGRIFFGFNKDVSIRFKECIFKEQVYLKRSNTSRSVGLKGVEFTNCKYEHAKKIDINVHLTKIKNLALQIEREAVSVVNARIENFKIYLPIGSHCKKIFIEHSYFKHFCLTARFVESFSLKDDSRPKIFHFEVKQNEIVKQRISQTTTIQDVIISDMSFLMTDQENFENIIKLENVKLNSKENFHVKSDKSKFHLHLLNVDGSLISLRNSI